MSGLTVVIRHGTADCYQTLACRCPPCTEGWTGFLRERRQARAATRAHPTPGGDPVPPASTWND